MEIYSVTHEPSNHAADAGEPGQQWRLKKQHSCEGVSRCRRNGGWLRPICKKNVAQDAIDDSVGAHYVASALLVCEMQE